MKSILWIVFSTLLSLVNSYQKLTSPTPATAEMFPYHAIIETNKDWTNAVLISKNFVLTSASSVDKKEVRNIYLGFSGDPRKQGDGQTFQAKQIYIQEGFGYLAATKYAINNFALIELSSSIRKSKTVKPIHIASPYDYPIPPGTFINQTGVTSFSDKNGLRFATVQMRDSDLCKLFYNNSFISSHQECVKHKGAERINYRGPYVVDGMLIGYQRESHPDATCSFTSPNCQGNDVYDSLENALSWIYRISGIAGVKGRTLFTQANPFWKQST